MMISEANLPDRFQNWTNSKTPSILSHGLSPDSVLRKSQKQPHKRLWFIAAIAAIVLAIIIIVVVPLAVILPKKGKQIYHASVMLPLYIYPENNNTWLPLFQSLSAHRALNFTVIINPSSGPGSLNGPDDQYSVALSQLSTFSNVKKVGYVRTGYASRNISDVISEIKTYAGWATRSQDFALDGIFFDESPHQFTQAAVDFMNTATHTAKAAAGLKDSKMVIRNPGVIPDARFDDINTDVTVVFEQSYDEYQVKASDLSALSRDVRAQHCYMVHSLPVMNKGQMRAFVDQMSVRAKHLFATNNKEGFYEKFGTNWADFTDTITA